MTITDQERKLVGNLRGQGKRIKDIAKELKRSASTVHKILMEITGGKHTVQHRPPTPPGWIKDCKRCPGCGGCVKMPCRKCALDAKKIAEKEAEKEQIVLPPPDGKSRLRVCLKCRERKAITAFGPQARVCLQCKRKK